MKPNGIMEQPIVTSPIASRLAKPNLFRIVPMKGEETTTAMEYMLKMRPTQKPGMDFSSKTLGKKRLASA